MCGYGSCRVEWWVHEDQGSGFKKYCVPHSKIINDINLKKAQATYRKRLSPGVIAERNAEYFKNNPNYQREYYLKRKAERLIKKVEL